MSKEMMESHTEIDSQSVILIWSGQVHCLNIEGLALSKLSFVNWVVVAFQ